MQNGEVAFRVYYTEVGQFSSNPIVSLKFTLLKFLTNSSSQKEVARILSKKNVIACLPVNIDISGTEVGL